MQARSLSQRRRLGNQSLLLFFLEVKRRLQVNLPCVVSSELAVADSVAVHEVQVALPRFAV
jgi:hypothetical protein